MAIPNTYVREQPMKYYDVFNGDADGICALQQIRLAEPLESTLISGVKRDIKLLEKVEPNQGDIITVLDVSLDKNRAGLEKALAQGARIRYFDHHYAGDIPAHENLATHIDPSPDTCTSLLVDQYLEGEYRRWAVVGAFGDNFDESARSAAAPLELSEEQLAQLRDLGIYINYNGYGASVEDLHFPPDELFRRLHPYADPLAFIADDDTFEQLREGYGDDMAKTATLRAEVETENHALFVLPAESWARRVSGVFANKLAQAAPQRAHALLTRIPTGGFVVSVRAPLANKNGADELCRQFPTGGGRKAAAGINRLPEELFDEFAARFRQAYG